MDFIPHTPDEFQSMLAALNLNDEKELFRTIPSNLHDPDISFPSPLSEMEITESMQTAAGENRGSKLISFLGGGAYNHFSPQAVAALISRSEFATAYTPYQPEVSQGTLQSIYEFQTLMCRLTGMDVANASMYDAASALAESALMACRITRKEKIVVSAGVNPHYRRVLKTYLDPQGIEWIEAPIRDGATDLDALKTGAVETIVDDRCAAFFVQNPNYYGVLEPVDQFRGVLDPKTLLGTVVNPHSLGILKAPGEWGADIVTGDLQPLGMPLQFGGPYAGFIACRQKHVRQLPGRLAGRTTDADGKIGYVLTLQTREQHIRRAKATSNICTNQALCALAAAIYMFLMGPKGLRQAAEASVRNAHILQERLCSLKGVEAVFPKPFFHEFLLHLPMPLNSFISAARDMGVLPGIPIAPAGGLEREALLVCATEKTRKQDIDFYVEMMSRILE
ncbi:MAG: aminomethyl-transferring glycine dehydrogenase subunit GcvPA [Candidatus Omnitrophica bacterium]|nr:aminomethyl-transferring glycine dehydrogenase subunit GcvPA [Candidatus Omnitrophota bacterium]